MQSFQDALICSYKNPMIPETEDIYGFLIGSWNVSWTGEWHGQNEHSRKAKWFFSRVLNGMAIQDVFIAEPSEIDPNGEYGTTFRIYNPETKFWDIYYGCLGAHTRLEGRKEKNIIIQTVENTNLERWVFSRIEADSFEWARYLCRNGEEWSIVARMYAERTD